MCDCEQAKGQSVWDHGTSVREWAFDLISLLKDGQTEDSAGYPKTLSPSSRTWRLPSWIHEYKAKIAAKLLPDQATAYYTQWHDCGKPSCRQVDADGKAHFPDHAKASAEKYRELFSEDGRIACLLQQWVYNMILWDMDVHTMKAEDVKEFCKREEAITLLIVALSELHSNANLFGGIESTSFKIKWKQIDKRGRAICKELFGEVPR
jgi:hypothetical protein